MEPRIRVHTVEPCQVACEIVVETSEDWQYHGRQATPDDLMAWFAARGFHAFLLPKEFVVDRLRPRRPERVRGPISPGYADLVFSRRDVEIL